MRGDWKGRHFLLLSLAVTAASIIFFFAAQYFSTNIKEGQLRLTQWVALNGGGNIQNVQFIVADQGSAVAGVLEAQLKPMMDELEGRLQAFKGESLWGIDLDDLQEEVLSRQWAEKVSVRRKFPSTLEVEVSPRRPHLLVHGSNGWGLVDLGGELVTFSNSLPGSWVSLPQVYGLESFLTSSASLNASNRVFEPLQEVIQETSLLIGTLSKKANIEVAQVHLKKDPWTDRYLFSVSWAKGEQKFEAEFLSSEWSQFEIDDLQFVLSELETKASGGYRILTQFSDRFIVQPMEGDDHG